MILSYCCTSNLIVRLKFSCTTLALVSLTFSPHLYLLLEEALCFLVQCHRRSLQEVLPSGIATGSWRDKREELHRRWPVGPVGLFRTGDAFTVATAFPAFHLTDADADADEEVLNHDPVGLQGVLLLAP